MDKDKPSDEPLKDTGSFSHAAVRDDDIEGHHSQNWQQHAMYVGLHFPSNKHGKKHHRHKRRHHKHGDKPHKEPGEKPEEKKDDPNKPATPPSQRVQFILGGAENADEDHQPHDIFCELEELRAVGDDLEWKETARWIKFEEDVEEGGERWSKPFVATLALHSLFELRKGILSGTVMLDMQADSLPQIVDLVLESMVATKQLEQDQRDRVSEVLLSRHKHQFDQHQEKKGLPIIRSLADIGRKASGSKVDKSDSAGLLTPNKSGPNLSVKGSSNDVESGGHIPETPSQPRFNEHFAKKVPKGAEASNILVGEVDFLQHPVLAFVRLNKAVLLGDLTEVPVPSRFIFILLGPTGNQERYHEIGRSIATLMSDEVFHDVAYAAKNRGDLLAGIDEFLDQVIVLPPGEWDPTIRIEPPKSVPTQEGRKKQPTTANGAAVKAEEAGVVEPADDVLKRTGKLFGGLIKDIKRKAPFYASDFKDALHVQSIASIFFMYFACLTPIITFGGLLGSATDNNIAAMESLVSGTLCGVTYHLFSGQPLTIIGSTGPILVFETIIFNVCNDNGLDYLNLRMWIGLWVSLFLLIMVAFDLSSLVEYITRFTEESFASLIALIFIVEAFKKLFHILDHDGVWRGDDDHPYPPPCECIEAINNTITYSSVTANITNVNSTDAMIAAALKLNETCFGGKNGNESILNPDQWFAPHDIHHHCVECGGQHIGGCDYSPNVFFLSVLIFLGTYVLASSLKEFRNATFFPTRVRSLLSDFAVALAIVIMVLIDMAIGINTPKLNVPTEFKPTRDDRGWYADPTKNPFWCIPAAIIPAILCTILMFMDQQITAVIVNRKENKLKKSCGYHLDLCIIAIQMAVCSILGTPWFVAATVLSINHVRSLTRESESAAPGEKPKFLGIREQRVTGIIVFLMVGLSVFLVPILLCIPMPVLYGVFLFMGVSSLNGVQLMQRLSLMLMPAKYQPDLVFLRHVPLRRVHLFTVIQALCLAILWVIKTIKSISIVFPLMVLAMCFIRKALDWVFTRHELEWLDDILPESHKREKEEKERTMSEGQDQEGQLIEMTGGAVNIPLQGGQSIKIPVDKISYDPESKEVNISEEMGKTAIWKQLAANETDPNISPTKDGVRNRKSHSISSDTKPAVFSIAEDDERAALMPEIVVDPPSKMASPDDESRPLKSDVVDV